MRASSISSGRSQPPSSGRGAARSASAVRDGELGRILRQRAPVDDAAADDPERVVARGVARVRGEHEPRARVDRAQHAAEAGEQRAQPRVAAAQPGGALVAAVGRGRAHLALDVVEQRGRAVVLAGEQAQRGVEALAVQVGVEVAQARRQAATHLAVGRGMVAARQRAPAVAQAEQRVELLDELGRRGAPAQRPDGHAVPDGRLGRDLEDRERDVEAAAQVDVAVRACA